MCGDVVTESRRLRDNTDGDLVIFGHTQLAETLTRAGLVDLLDISHDRCVTQLRSCKEVENTPTC